MPECFWMQLYRPTVQAIRETKPAPRGGCGPGGGAGRPLNRGSVVRSLDSLASFQSLLVNIQQVYLPLTNVAQIDMTAETYIAQSTYEILVCYTH